MLFGFVDDAFVQWHHGKDQMEEFLQHINSIHINIKFTIEIEQD